MKNLVRLQLWDAILPVALLLSLAACTLHLQGQNGPGGKPEIMAPIHDMAHDKVKVPSTSLTLAPPI